MNISLALTLCCDVKLGRGNFFHFGFGVGKAWHQMNCGENGLHSFCSLVFLTIIYREIKRGLVYDLGNIFVVQNIILPLKKYTLPNDIGIFVALVIILSFGKTISRQQSWL